MFEHLCIHALVRQLAGESEQGAVPTGTLLELAEALQSHVRFEEKVVFPMIEERVPEATLGSVSLVARQR